MRWWHPFTSAFMLSATFVHWGEKGYQTRYTWVDVDDISPNAALAVIASEDQQFPFHAGFDLKSIRKAVRQNEHRKRPRGASTISQQVAKNLFLWNGGGYVRKGIEACLTVLIELRVAEGAHPRGVSERRAVRAWRVRCGSGVPHVLSQAGCAAHAW